MAQILDILNIQPNKISTDLTSYNFLLYSMPGIGKTSLAVSLFPEKHFILGAEYGFKGIPGAIGVAVPDYFSLNQYVKQLDTVEARERFDTIIVDTTSKIGSMIEEYVLSQYGKNFLGDCKQHGGAYPLINRYYDLAFNKLKARGYNFVYICHANETSVTNEEGVELYKRYSPKMSDRIRNLIEPEVDYTFFLTLDKDGNRIVVTDNTPKNVGKQRNNLPTCVKLEKDAKTLKEEIAKGILEKGGEFITNEKTITTVVQGKIEERPYTEVIEEIKTVGKKLAMTPLGLEAREITNNGLGTDSDGRQRTLNEMTQLNYQVLIKILADLKALEERL